MRVRTLSIALFSTVIAAGALIIAPRVALANSNGSDPGCSGKTGIPNDLCTSCGGQCHTGGPVPTVAFAGPATIDAGDTATYTFTITTTQPKTGCDIAVTNGVTINHGTNTQDEFGELTQPAPQAVTGGSSVYTFTVVGPQYGGTIELWGSGNAVNGNGNTSGDNAADGTMMITVNGPPNPGGGGAVGDAGGDGTGLNGGLLPDGGSTNGLVALADGGYAAPGDPNAGNGLTDDDTLHQQSGNCSVNGNDLGRTGSGLLASGLVVCGLLFAGRRRRRRK
ncbi:MAG: choice-of-anchor V domain-containing protein [Polyangiaceae bacterium]